jgi:hypothetical protein
MKNIRKIHSEAMHFVNEAQICLGQRKNAEYRENLEKALTLEEEAALELYSKLDNEPTRSVLFRSAANIAFNLGYLDRSEKLVFQGLSGNPFAETKAELNEIRDKIELSLSMEQSPNDIVEYNYVNLLKENAINLRVEPKTERFSKAVMVESVVDFLRNLQSSYKNFAEVSFKKMFAAQALENPEHYQNALLQIRRESQLLLVDLQFQSFGIGVIADTGIMNYSGLMSEEYNQYKKNVFDNFKEDVIYPDFNSEVFKDAVSEKYTESERTKIYSPIINSLEHRSSYRVSISDQNFRHKVKDIPTIDKKTIPLLKPKAEVTYEPDLIIKKTLELTDTEGLRRSKLQQEFLTYAEFYLSIKDISEKIYPLAINFIDPHSLKVVFSENKFSITDNVFDIYTEGKDLRDVEKNYNSILIYNYQELVQIEEKTPDQLRVFEEMNARFLVTNS